MNKTESTLYKNRPATCLSIREQNEDEILKKAALFSMQDTECSLADMIEWRADHFENLHDTEKVCEVAVKIKKSAGKKPIIFTIRTEEKHLSRKIVSIEKYIELCLAIIDREAADYVDVEFSAGEKVVKTIVDAARKKDISIILSYHNFNTTPNENTLEKIIASMNNLLPKSEKLDRNKNLTKNEDSTNHSCTQTTSSFRNNLIKNEKSIIPQSFIKICTMADDYEDVREMLLTAIKHRKKYGERNLFIVMGIKGILTRIAGGFFDAPITFCTSTELQSASAELQCTSSESAKTADSNASFLGQLNIKKTISILNKLDDVLL